MTALAINIQPSEPVVDEKGRPALSFQRKWQNVAGTLTSLDAAHGGGAVTVTSAYSVGDDDYLILVNCTAGAVTVTLPPVVDNTSRNLVVKKVDASGNAVTIDGNAAETIDGAATRPLSAQYDALKIACDGTQWWIV